MNFRNIKSIEELLKMAQEEDAIQNTPEYYSGQQNSGGDDIQTDADGRQFKMVGGEVQYLLPSGNWSSTPPPKKEDPAYSQGGNDTVEYPKKSKPSIREFAESTKGNKPLIYNYGR